MRLLFKQGKTFRIANIVKPYAGSILSLALFIDDGNFLTVNLTSLNWIEGGRMINS